MSCVVCSRAGRRREWGDVTVWGQLTELFSFSTKLLLRVPILEVRGVVATFAFFTGRGRDGLVRHASCRREKEGWDAKLGMQQRGQFM